MNFDMFGLYSWIDSLDTATRMIVYMNLFIIIDALFNCGESRKQYTKTKWIIKSILYVIANAFKGNLFLFILFRYGWKTAVIVAISFFLAETTIELLLLWKREREE